MTLRRKISWLAVFWIVATAVGIVLHDRFMAGPVYNGAPLSVWLRLLDDPSPQTRDRARDAIRHLGPAAMPLVMEWLDWSDSLLRRLLIAWVAADEQHLNFHPLEPKERRRLALDACDVLGPDAQPAVPKLLTLANAPNPELDAPFVIARIGGSNALPALTRLSGVTNKFIRAAAGVSVDLVRNHSIALLPSPTAASADNNYRRRLQEYHSLVMEAVTSGRVLDSASPPARIP